HYHPYLLFLSSSTASLCNFSALSLILSGNVQPCLPAINKFSLCSFNSLLSSSLICLLVSFLYYFLFSKSSHNYFFLYSLSFSGVSFIFITSMQIIKIITNSVIIVTPLFFVLYYLLIQVYHEEVTMSTLILNSFQNKKHSQQ